LGYVSYRLHCGSKFQTSVFVVPGHNEPGVTNLEVQSPITPTSKIRDIWSTLKVLEDTPSSLSSQVHPIPPSLQFRPLTPLRTTAITEQCFLGTKQYHPNPQKAGLYFQNSSPTSCLRNRRQKTRRISSPRLKGLFLARI